MSGMAEVYTDNDATTLDTPEVANEGKQNQDETTASTDPEQHLLREAFRLFDNENDGFINPRKLFNGMRALGFNPTEAEVQDLIATIDYQGTGVISYEDFTHTMSLKLTKVASVDEVKDVFSVFDQDNNGLVTADDINNLFIRLGRQPSTERFQRIIEASDLREANGITLDDMLKLLSEDPSLNNSVISDTTKNSTAKTVKEETMKEAEITLPKPDRTLAL